MKEYHKIQTVFKRDDKTHRVIEGIFSLPEFEYLQNNKWIWTEKVDGTNIRIIWDKEKVKYGGKTDNASIPAFLIERLQQLFPIEKLKALYPDISMCLYGEGYGAKIQKGGENYNLNGVDYVLFDIKIENWWLMREGVEDIADKLELKVVPIIGQGTLNEMIEKVKIGLNSQWGDFIAEGIVAKPQIELLNRMGHRIITKIKYKDFDKGASR
jgi:ATP-dependent RNA circularization protein (DNA/RNA ligase family)